jgi:hypothetical protein
VPYGWSSRDRLCPMRMVPWVGETGFKFELERWRKPSIRKRIGSTRAIANRVAEDRVRRRDYPGKIWEWPVYRYGKRVSE